MDGIRRNRSAARRLIAATAVGLGVTLGLGTGVASATFAGANGVIAVTYSFAANEGPTPPEWGMFTVQASGKHFHQLRKCDTFRTCDDWADVAFSRTGNALAWDVSPRGKQFLVVASGNGTDQRTVAPGFEPSFSPTGELLFVRYDGASRQIVLRNLNTERDAVLLTMPRVAHPEMSPNGQQIVFDHGPTIWTMNADGSGVRPMIPDGRDPSWSPDSTRLLYIGTKSSRIFVAQADGSHRRELPLPVKQLCYPPRCGGGTEFAVYSPDGKQIAFDNPDDGGDPVVWVVAAAGGKPKQIAAVETDSAGGDVDGLSWQSRAVEAPVMQAGTAGR